MNYNAQFRQHDKVKWRIRAECCKNDIFNVRGEEWSFEVGTTVAVGILLALSLAVALLLYWRYREEEAHYLQVGSLSICSFTY